ncbi:MAG: tripartite tricarboxylate transporter substrate binding protein [Betaproteobacteria bacterium]|nr:tripartite tricarboxylate transporter substrate binding protein [Betaproteobacteria bacterium]
MNKLKQAMCWQLAGLAILFTFITPAIAQKYPVRPIRVVVGFIAGGTIDATARLVAQTLHETWGQTVVVDNRPGVGGNLGAAIVAKANADGYTLLMTSPGPVAINPSLMKLPYNPRTELAPITLVAFGPNVLVVPMSSAATSLKEFIALARGSSKRLSYGSSGLGSTPHLSTELLKMMANVDMVHVPYKGSNQAAIDLIAARIDLMIVSAPTVLGHIRAQRLRALGVTSLERISVLSDVPTFNEAGVPGYEAGAWWGMMAPGGTPAELIHKLQQAIAASLKTAEVSSRILASGAIPVGNNPRAFGEYIEKETSKWAAVIKRARITLE